MPIAIHYDQTRNRVPGSQPTMRRWVSLLVDKQRVAGKRRQCLILFMAEPTPVDPLGGIPFFPQTISLLDV